jgi:nucleoside 2-deoxyribosyltransferase
MPRTLPHRVYCAGPLFCQAERDEMTAIADRLVAAGYEVYLPHRDGMEFRLVRHCLIDQGWEPHVAGQFLHQAIFALDVYQLVEACQSVVWNLNGRVPDEGAVSEAAIAWTLGKPIVAYKEDVRTLIEGRDNPLLAGLVDFHFVRSLEEIVPALADELLKMSSHSAVRHGSSRPSRAVEQAVEAGRSLWQALCEHDASGNSAAIAEHVAQLFAPEGLEPALASQARVPSVRDQVV